MMIFKKYPVRERAERILFWTVITLLSGTSGFVGGSMRTAFQTPEESGSVPIRTIVREDTARGASAEQKNASAILSAMSARMGSLYRWHAGQQDAGPLAQRLPQASQFLGYALIVTSDGWFVTSAAIDPHVVPLSIATHDTGVLPVTRVVRDDTAGYTFLKTAATNLSPIQFPSFNDTLSLEDGYLIRNSMALERILVSQPLLPSAVALYAQVQATPSIQKLLNPDQAFGTTCMPVVRDERIVLGCTTPHGIRSFRYLQRSLADLLRKGSVERPTLSIPFIDLSASLLPLNTSFRTGALVTLVGKKPLRLSGPDKKTIVLYDGDIILSVNGEQIDQNRNLTELLNQYARGEILALRVLSDGNEAEIKIILN